MIDQIGRYCSATQSLTLFTPASHLELPPSKFNIPNRNKLGPVFAGTKQPSFNQSMIRYGGNVRALIEASGRTNKTINVMGLTGVGIGTASCAGRYGDDDLGVMVEYQASCGCCSND